MDIYYRRVKIRRLTRIVWSLCALGAAISPALNSEARAQETIAAGRITMTEGHENPNCRRIRLQKDDGTVMWFRIPAGADNGILAVALTALSAGKRAEIGYLPSVTTTCGTEPKAIFISILSPS